jgi:hypothetical protein
MWLASKQQTTALFLFTIVTRTRRHTELTNLMGNLCCAREHSVQFFVQFFFTQLNCTVSLRVYGALKVSSSALLLRSQKQSQFALWLPLPFPQSRILSTTPSVRCRRLTTVFTHCSTRFPFQLFTKRSLAFSHYVRFVLCASINHRLFGSTR